MPIDPVSHATQTHQISDAEFDYAIEKLKDFVAIPSVSHPQSPHYSMENLKRAADFASGLLKEIGFSPRQVSIDGSAPYVLAEMLVDPAKPTILAYAHYDLQPVDPSQWKSDPFVLTERDGRLYGRGASDDKGGMIAIITALGAYLKAYGALPVNVKILFEGEEEYSSSPHMEDFLKLEAEYLQADALVVMDVNNLNVNTGTLTSSTRGVVNLTMEVKTMEEPVHSGLGCLVRDPSLLLAELMVSLKDPRKIPGFMEGRDELKPAEREILSKDSQSAEEYARNYHLVEGEILRGDPALSVYERISEEPSISFVNGEWGKCNGGNSIQSSARCQIGVRMTAGQDPDKVAECVKAYLQDQAQQRNIPVFIELTMKGSFPWKGDLSGPFTQMYFAALEAEFGKTHAQPCGGALPLLRTFQEAQPHMEMILPGVEDPACAAHGHNESQDKGLLRRATNALIGFLHRAGEA